MINQLVKLVFPHEIKNQLEELLINDASTVSLKVFSTQKPSFMDAISIKKIPFQRTWPIRHRVMWPKRELDYVKIPEDPEGVHYGLFLENKLISILSVFIKEGQMQFRKFATEIPFQGRGYGSHLLGFVFEQAKKQGIKRIWCNARIGKTAFYQQFGMNETAQTFEKGGIQYVIMEKLMAAS